MRDIQDAFGNNSDSVESDLSEFLGEDANAPEFWERVQANLELGKLRLIILADSIPVQLRRIVEFLNKQMSPAEFLAVEVKQFEFEGQKVLVPRVLGLTEAVRQKKASSTSIGKQWDERMFMTASKENAGEEVCSLVQDLLKWITPQVSHVFWGQGQKNSCFIPTIRTGKVDYQVCRMNSDGVFVFRFDWLNKKPPFDNEVVLRELLGKINSIPGIYNRFGEEVISSRARFPFLNVSTIESIDALKSALAFIIDSVKSVPRIVSGIANT